MQTGEQCPTCGNDYDPMHQCPCPMRITSMTDEIWDDACKEGREVKIDIYFQKDDVANALDLLLHMVGVLAQGGNPALEDMEEVRELIAQIRNSRPKENEHAARA